MGLTHRRLRRNLTETESLLWQVLRNRQLDGHKFRRQHPIGPFIADFVCLESRLVVELDGKVHDGRQTYDESRTESLRSLGYAVIRFRNVEIHRNIQSVLARILQTLHAHQKH